MARAQINNYACKLRLLQYGLIEEAHTVGNMELRKGARGRDDSSDDDSDDEDDVDLMQRRNAYVKRCIANLPAGKRNRNHLEIVKDPTAAEMRRNLVRDFLKDASAVKKCTSCSGLVPPLVALTIAYEDRVDLFEPGFPRLIAEISTPRSSENPFPRRPEWP